MEPTVIASSIYVLSKIIKSKIDQVVGNPKDFKQLSDRVESVVGSLQKLQAKGDGALPKDDAFIEHLVLFEGLLKEIVKYIERFNKKHMIRKVVFSEQYHNKFMHFNRKLIELLGPLHLEMTAELSTVVKDVEAEVKQSQAEIAKQQAITERHETEMLEQRATTDRHEIEITKQRATTNRLEAAISEVAELSDTATDGEVLSHALKKLSQEAFKTNKDLAQLESFYVPLDAQRTDNAKAARTDINDEIMSFLGSGKRVCMLRGQAGAGAGAVRGDRARSGIARLRPRSRQARPGPGQAWPTVGFSRCQTARMMGCARYQPIGVSGQ